MNGWRYYNHALMPINAPHENVDITALKDKKIWKMGDRPLFARWTSDFDCGYETNWWYCIKDTPFDISLLKSKKRYEINKGKRNFNVKIIDPREYSKEIVNIQIKTWMEYPETYRPKIDEEKLLCSIEGWSKYIVFAAFGIEDDSMQAFACLKEYSDWIDFAILKANSEAEKRAVNAAIVAGICEYYNDRLSKGAYICDGERNIVHQTAFQDYLEKYFGFRKAYCKLNIVYQPVVGVIVKILYPFRVFVSKFNNTKIGNKVTAVLRMENIVRGR